MAGAADGSTEISEDVQAFLRDVIASYEALEVLLLLHADGAPRSVDELAAALRAPRDIVSEALVSLSRQALIETSVVAGGEGYHYRPTSLHAEVVDRLSATCKESRVAVMRLMTTNAVERRRASALRTFANAFVLGRKEDDDG